MAVSNEDLARLIVTLEVTTTKFYNGMRKAQQQTNQVASGIESRLTTMSGRVDKTFANLGQRLSANITGPLAGIGAAFSTREIIKYADTWTSAGNQIRAAGQIVGLQGRPLEQIRQLADDSRASFSETVTLYSRLLRAAGGVADSELDIAKATTIVNKAFKAGGSATSEMNAGIIQLSQGLSSGILAGDELRSVRENAPVLAKVIADYFKTTVGGLKELGAQGKLTSAEVFKAILSGESQISDAFATTNSTIADSFLKVENALIQYIGQADHSNGVTAALTGGLSALADNFDSVADVALKFASIIAGVLVGRSIAAMVGGIGSAVKVLNELSFALKLAQTNGARLGAIFTSLGGPLALLIAGGAALAFEELASQAADGAEAVAHVSARVDELGISSVETAKSIREAALATSDLTAETIKLREAERQREVAVTKQAEPVLRQGSGLDNFSAPFTANKDLKSAYTIANRAYVEFVAAASDSTDQFVSGELKKLAEGLTNSTIPAKEVLTQIRALNDEPVSQNVLDLLDALDAVAIQLNKVDIANGLDGVASGADAAKQEVISLLEELSLSAQINGDFEYKKGVDALIEKLKQGQDVSAETKVALENLSGATGDFSALNAGIQSAIDKVIALGLEALNANENIKLLQQTKNNDARFAGRNPNDVKDPFAAGKKYLDQQNQLLTTTERQRDVLDEVAKIKKELGDSYLSPQAITDLATKRIDQKASDKASRSTKQSPGEKFTDTLDKEQRSNELLAAEYDLRAQLNPLIDDHGYALERLQKKQELMNQAAEKGVALGPEEIKRIDDIAEAYASGKARLDELAESQQKVKDRMQEWVDLGKSATRGFIDDLIEGKSAAEAFGNVLSQLGSKLIDLGLNSLFGGGGGDFGLLGQLFNFGKVPGRAGGGPVRAGQPYVVGEKRPELFVPSQNGTIIPKLPGTNSNSGNINAPVNINIDATGADASGLARLQSELAGLKSELPYMIRSTVSNRSKKGW